MGTRPKTRYNDLISTSINDGRRGLHSHSHSDSHPHSHDIPRALCRSTGVVGWHWAFLPCRGTEVTYGVLPAQEAVPSLFDIRCLFFFFSFSFFVVYLINSPTPLYIFISLSTSCVSFLVFFFVALPLALDFLSFPFFSFIVGRDAILLNLYAYAMQIRKRISVAALEWSGC